MTGALIILMAVAVTGLVLYLLHRRNPGADAPVEPQAEEECCGRHTVCEKSSLQVTDTAIEYFDDEELDRFAGREPADYSEADADEFRDVMLTMAPAEVASWSRSLQLRGIALPAMVRDELLMIVDEQRNLTPANV